MFNVPFSFLGILAGSLLIVISIPMIIRGGDKSRAAGNKVMVAGGIIFLISFLAMMKI